MVRSIRVRLLVWYAIVLTGVVGGFAGLLYYEVRAARLAEVDAQLDAAAASLESALRLFPPFELTGESPPPPKKFGPPPKKGPPGWPPEHPDFGPEFGPGPGPQGPGREHLLASLDPPGRPAGMYFAVWRADGVAIKAVATAEPPPTSTGRTVRAFRGTNRELITPGPGG